MGKMKTHSGAKKRMKVTGAGNVKHKSTNLRHRLRKRDKKRKRHLNIDGLINFTEMPRVRRMLLIANS